MKPKEIKNARNTGYPCLKRYKNTNLVVNFISREAGYVVSGNMAWDVGEFFEYWAEYDFKEDGA